MEWTLCLVGAEIDGQSRSVEVMAISRPDGLGEIANLGLTLAEAKLLLAQVQQQLVAEQASTHATLRPDCRSCGETCQVKDWQLHHIATFFGEVKLKRPRFLCAGCSRGETGVSWPSHCRSTPELNQLQARLSALMPYRIAADVLQHLLPIDAGTSPETLRSHTLQVGKQLREVAAEKPPIAPAAITISLDSTFIRSCKDDERRLEVRVGNVETKTGGRLGFRRRQQDRDRHHRVDPANLGNHRPNRHHQSDCFHRRLSGSTYGSGQRRCHEAADFGLVSYRDAAAAHEAGGGQFVERQP